jgi:hypothetical protein
LVLVDLLVDLMLLAAAVMVVILTELVLGVLVKLVKDLVLAAAAVV